MSTLRKVCTILVPPIAPDVDPFIVGHAGVESLGVFALEVQRNLTVEALAAQNPESYVGVGLVGSNDITATRPADEREVFVGFI